MATDLKEFELAKVARFHAETILQSEEYDAEASCLFPKLDFNQQNEEGEGKREGGQGANQRTGSVQGQASEVGVLISNKSKHVIELMLEVKPTGYWVNSNRFFRYLVIFMRGMK